MTFWDRLKPAPKLPAASQVERTHGGTVLRLTWEDGATTQIRAQALRQNCPCASCVDEGTRQRTLDPRSVGPDTRVLEVRPVGNYAISCLFSDAHQTGIYEWSLLRRLSEPVPGP